MDVSSELHPSKLTTWMRCEIRALHEEARPPEDDSWSVAAWIGSAVHAYCASHPEPEPPDSLRFDQLTPTMRVARQQILRMSAVMGQSLRESGIEVVAVEEKGEVRFFEAPWLQVTGTADIRGRIGGDGVIADIKTGRSLEAAWLQIGAYAEMRDGIEYGAVFHLPRREPHKIANQAAYEIRPIRPIAEAARRACLRVARLLSDPEMATHSPGAWCALCNVRGCPVRAYPYRWETKE